MVWEGRLGRQRGRAMFLGCRFGEYTSLLRVMWLLMLNRLGVPNTPRVGSAGRVGTARKRGLETPSARVKAEPGSSPPTFKTPQRPGEFAGTP